MALATRKQPLPARHGKPCSIAQIYRKVAGDPVELSELNIVLYEEDNNQAQVFEILTRDGGFTLGFQSVNNHRGKTCRCFREQPSMFCHACRRDIPSCVCEAAA